MTTMYTNHYELDCNSFNFNENQEFSFLVNSEMQKHFQPEVQEPIRWNNHAQLSIYDQLEIIPDTDYNCKATLISPRHSNCSTSLNTMITQSLPSNFYSDEQMSGNLNQSDFSGASISNSSQAVTSPIQQQEQSSRTSTQGPDSTRHETQDSGFISRQIDQSSLMNGQFLFTNSGDRLIHSQGSSNQQLYQPIHPNELVVSTTEEQKRGRGRPHNNSGNLVTSNIKEKFVKENRSVFRKMKKLFKNDYKLKENIKALLGDSAFRSISKEFEKCVTLHNSNYSLKKKSQVHKECTLLQLVCYQYSKEALEMFFQSNEYRTIFRQMIPMLKNSYQGQEKMLLVIDVLDEISKKFLPEEPQYEMNQASYQA